MQKIYAWIEEKKIAKYIFCLAYAIELAVMLIDKSALVNPYEGWLFRIAFMLFVIKILMTDYRWYEWIAMLGLGAIAYLSYHYSGRNDMLRMLAMVMACKGIDIRKAMKTTLYVTTIAVALMMLLSFCGVLGYTYMESDFDGSNGAGGVIRRYCFGLGHPNAYHCMIMCILLLAVYVYWEQLKWWHGLVIVVVDLFVYYFTRSKTGLLVVLLLAVLVIIAKSVKNLEKSPVPYISALLTEGAVLWGALEVAATDFELDTPFLKWADNALTGRLMQARWQGGYWEWRLFSNASKTNYFDMGINRLFYWYGKFPATICLIIIGAFIVYCYLRRDIVATIVIICMLVYTFVEAHFVSEYIARNYILLLLGGCLTAGVVPLKIKKNESD